MMLCVNCNTQPGYPHARHCLRPKFFGLPDGVGSEAQDAATGPAQALGDVLAVISAEPPAASEVPIVGGAGDEVPCQGSGATPSLDTYGDNSTAAHGEPVADNKTAD